MQFTYINYAIYAWRKVILPGRPIVVTVVGMEGLRQIVTSNLDASFQWEAQEIAKRRS